MTRDLPAKWGARGQQPLPVERPAPVVWHLSAVTFTAQRSRQTPAPLGVPGEQSCQVCI